MRTCIGSTTGNEAIIKGNWKAVKNNNKKYWESYAPSVDRSETKNVATRHPELMEELISKWREWANSDFVFPKRLKQTNTETFPHGKINSSENIRVSTLF